MARQPQADVFRDLGALLAHDLCNPLQSITVLLELLQDDLPDNSVSRRRIAQSLEATAQMRRILRDYSAIVRERGLNGVGDSLETVLDRCLGIFGRRVDAGLISVQRELEGVGETTVDDPALEATVLGFFLAVIAGARDCRAKSVTLTIRAFESEQRDAVTLDIGLAGARVGEEVFDRLRGSLGDSQVHMETSELALQLTWPRTPD